MSDFTWRDSFKGLLDKYKNEVEKRVTEALERKEALERNDNSIYLKIIETSLSLSYFRLWPVNLVNKINNSIESNSSSYRDKFWDKLEKHRDYKTLLKFLRNNQSKIKELKNIPDDLPKWTVENYRHLIKGQKKETFTKIFGNLLNGVSNINGIFSLKPHKKPCCSIEGSNLTIF